MKSANLVPFNKPRKAPVQKTKSDGMMREDLG
jgi:hypothetical protein